jgi:GNAT superfamily N-acetyltransferase
MHDESQQKRQVNGHESIETTDTGQHGNAELVIRRIGKPGDLGWMIMANMEVYNRQFQWNTEYETLVSQIVADYAANHDPRKETGWIAELGSQRVGCVLCIQDKTKQKTAKLRILLVCPEARGLGVGRKLVDECLQFARGVGYERVTLWTNDVLVSARRIYEATGFGLVEAERHFSFGKELVGQNWVCVL